MENRKNELGGTTTTTATTHTTNNTTNNASGSSNTSAASSATVAVAQAAVPTPGAVNNNNNSTSSNTTNSCSMALVAVTTAATTAAAVTAVATTTTAAAAATPSTATTSTTTPTSSPSPSIQTPPAHHHHHHHHHHGHHGHQGSSFSSANSMTSNTTSLTISASSSTSSSATTRTRPAVFDKLEQLVRDMQDDERGVPVRSQKMFLTSIPAAFMGYDLIEWLMDRLSIEDSLEAVHLANLLCQFGYYFPINELKNLLVKDDSSLYRFQTPYYWPSQHHTPDNIEYAIYLDKRSQRNRQKHGLEDYELDAYNNLKKILANKWEFVMMQADEQLKIAKDRKKGEKIVTDSQEKAYWRVYRPPPGYTTVVESSPVPTREQRSKARSRTREHLTDEYEFLKNYFLTSRSKVSQVAESLIDYTDNFMEYDPVLNPVIPSNPWVTDEATYWILNQPIVDIPTEKRVRKWAISLEDLISDPLGLQELLSYMKKEYSHENLRFWLAVQDLRRGPGSEAHIKKHVKEIWDEFLAPGAKAEINIDSQTMELTKQNMKNPTRFTFEEAAGHIYLLLLKKDCYPRFIRSESYKSLLANALKPRNMKKPFFNFPARKKPPVPATSGQGGQGGSCTIVNTKERMWEEFNIYGAQGGDNSDSPETNTFDSRNLCRDINESVCPWDNFEGKERKSPRGSVGSGGGGSHKRRGSDPAISTTARSGGGASGGAGASAGGASNPSESGVSPQHHGKHRSHHQSTLGEGKTCSGAAKSCSATRTSSLENSLERSSSCRRRVADGRGSLQEDGSVGHHHHHHHHHHGHGAGTSRRSKNRSKRKKTSMRSSTLTSAGELAAAIAAAATSSTATTATTATQFNAPPTTLHQSADHRPHHQPPHHQHSASSLLSSVVAPASVLMVGQSFDRSSGTVTIPPLIVSAGNGSSVTTATAIDAEVTGPPTTTSSKCTQTKLEDEDELFNIPTSPTLARQSPVRAPQLSIQSKENSRSKDLAEDAEQMESSVNTTAAGTTTAEASTSAITSVSTSTSTATMSGATAATPVMMIVTQEKPVPCEMLDPGPVRSDPSTSKGGRVDPEPSKIRPGSGIEPSKVHAGSNSVGEEDKADKADCKGDIGTWASSTEVCPWEDEENRRDTHPPFVKTYATLGFL